MLHNRSRPVEGPRLRYGRDGEAEVSFPPDTKAFLYYFTPPGKPRIAGELRLRVTSCDDPASFESGYDLLTSDGRPWSRSFIGLSKYHIPLYEKLREEHLVPDDLDAVLSTFPPNLPIGKYNNQRLYTLNDTLIVDFDHSPSFSVITEQGMEVLQFNSAFYDSTVNRRPYTGAYTNHHLSIDDSNESVGSVLVRFERSTLPEHQGTRTVVLRILKIITSLKCVIPHYDGNVVMPEEGELHRRYRRYANYKPNLRVWNIDIDKRKGAFVRSLKLLWDA